MPLNRRSEIRDGIRFDEEARGWLAGIADLSDAATVGTDLDGIVTVWNKAAEAMFGYRRDDIVGHPVTCFIPPDRIDEHNAAVDRVRGGWENILHLETQRLCKDGAAVAASLKVSAIHDGQDRVIGICMVAHDRSERAEHAQLRVVNAELERLAGQLVKERDRAEQANRARSNFLAGMSHELCTPLNAILGYAQLLDQDGRLDATQGARVQAMLGAGRHLLEMITCVLGLSEIETADAKPRIAEVDVQAIASACLDLVRPAAEAKHLALSCAVALGATTGLVVDPLRLRQVLLSLLTNAVKLTRRGSVALRLQPLADGSALRIEVADADREAGGGADVRGGPDGGGGPGVRAGRDAMDAPDDDEEARPSLAARLAALGGGGLRQDDFVNGGRLLWLEVPLETVAVPVWGQPPCLTEDQPAAALRVLVVDDIAMNREIAGSFLRSAGHAVTCVEGGEEAIVAVAMTDFDVVLMDVRMPVMDGLEATRRIRALCGARGRVPIVALTVQSDAEQVAECRAAGMDDHLAKPFDPDALHAAVVRAFEARQPHGESVGQSVVPPVVPAPEVVSGLGEVCVIGTEMAVFDLRVFERAAISLAPEMVASSLRTITERSHELLRGLHAPDALERARDQLAEAALTLAGSAGILGFKRLTAVGRRFERAVRTGAVEVHVLAFALSAALEASLKEISDRMSVAVGAGLGLALSARLAASLGGRRGHSANPDGGSVFWMELPLSGGGAGVVTPPAAGILNVLVVDDIMMNRDIAGSFLRSAGHTVTCVDGGAAAVAAVAATDFDVVLMDVRMPEMDGLEATRRIRALGVGRGRVPIVALTANTFSDQVAECIAAGMDHHLAKPFDLDRLLGAIARVTAPGRLPVEGVGGTSDPALPEGTGAELPVFDRRAFDRTAIFLAPEAVASYLQTIAECGEPLLRGLWGAGALTRIRFELAEAAHTLAGSAGMLGFERLASLGCLFERAVQSNAPEVPALANGLSAALEATLQEIHDRISVTLGAGPAIALSARLTALMAGRERREGASGGGEAGAIASPDTGAGSGSGSADTGQPTPVSDNVTCTQGGDEVTAMSTGFETVAVSSPEPPCGVEKAAVAALSQSGTSGVQPAPAAHRVVVDETDLPVLDTTAFDRTAAFLTPEAVVSYLQTVADRGAALLRRLDSPSVSMRTTDDVVAAAHTLAGSAGLLGFRRVAAAGRGFEQAARGGAANAPALADGLRAAIEATLQEIRRRVPVGAGA